MRFVRKFLRCFIRRSAALDPGAPLTWLHPHHVMGVMLSHGSITWYGMVLGLCADKAHLFSLGGWNQQTAQIYAALFRPCARWKWAALEATLSCAPSSYNGLLFALPYEQKSLVGEDEQKTKNVSGLTKKWTFPNFNKHAMTNPLKCKWGKRKCLFLSARHELAQCEGRLVQSPLCMSLCMCKSGFKRGGGGIWIQRFASTSS